MDSQNDQPDLLSEFSEVSLLQHLLADLHDGLPERLARFHQLVDLTATMGSSGTMLFGGETTYVAWNEARWSFISGNYIATVLLCQGLIEHLLGSFLFAGLMADDLPPRVHFSEILRRCMEKRVIGERESVDLKRLASLRNPLSHFRDVNDPTSLSKRAFESREPALQHLRGDATFALSVTVRVLSLPSFRLRR